MNRIKLTVRIPAGQETMLRHIAEVRGLTRYQALARVIEIGLTSVMHPSGRPETGDVNGEIATIAARLSSLEAVADRGLFTASAAYTYARRAALRGDNDPDKTDAALGEAAQAAYKRQRALAAEAV
jgi:hypothetical protein